MKQTFNKQTFGALYNLVKAPIVVFNTSSSIVFKNKAYKQFSGEKSGVTPSDLKQNEATEALVLILKQDIIPALQTKTHWEGIVFYPHKNEGLIRTNVDVAALSAGEDETFYIFTFKRATEISELHEKVNEYKVIFRSLFHKTSDILFLYSTDENGLPTNFIDINNTATKLLGYSRKALLENSILDIIADGSRALVYGISDQLAEHAVVTMQLTMLKENGNNVELDVEAQYVNYERRPAILLIAKNITEKRELENKLLQIEKLEAVGQLAGGIAHDFNNVLAGISGLAELALRKLDPEDKAASFIKTIFQKANNSANMVRQLVAFSRKQTLSPKPTDLNKVINDNYKLLERYLGEAINFELDLYSALSIIKIDPASIDQIVTNLCINARDAMPDGGELLIKTREVTTTKQLITTSGAMPPGKYILFSIQDSGVGIPPDVISHIFEPFFTTKDIGYGTGLGLSIVYGLVKQNDGFINCSSELGEGTQFNIYFPWYSYRKDIPAISKPKKVLTGNETILIAEDEADVILFLKESLEGFGYNVLMANNGLKALELYEQNKEEIDLVISDIVMPEMGGVELKMVLENMNPNLRFIYISAYTHRFEPDAPFLQKPFMIEDLATTVRDVLDGFSTI